MACTGSPCWATKATLASGAGRGDEVAVLRRAQGPTAVPAVLSARAQMGNFMWLTTASSSIGVR